MSHTHAKIVVIATHYLSQVLGLALLLTLLSSTAVAQTAPPSSSSDGITPIGMKPGSPAGSYALSGFDDINYFSGLMNHYLPLYFPEAERFLCTTRAGWFARLLVEFTFRQKFERYTRCDPKNADLKRKAYTACAAKMARVIYGLMKDQSLYRAYHEDAVPDGRTRSHGPLRRASEEVAMTS